MPVSFVGRNNDDEIYNKILELRERHSENVKLITEVSRDEIRDVYRQSTAVVCTSRDDPMPVFMTESLMLSVPVICSEYTGTYSLLDHKKSGLTYHNNDSDELADMLIYVLEHPDDVHHMGHAGRKVYENYFTEEAFRKRFYAVIEGIDL